MGRRAAQVNAHREAFLANFRLTGNVSASAEAANVDRRTPYKWAAEDPDFKAAWDEAEQVAIDALELEARRRAKDGVVRLKVSGGKVVTYTDDEGREVPYTEREYSDQLLITLLKAHRPERYSERLRAEVTQAEPLKITLDFGSREQA